MKTDLEIQLEASILYTQMRKKVEDLTEKLAAVMHENELLAQELKLAELKLQRLARPRMVS